MVNIFGMKFFESPSMEEQMHHKGRSHGSNCGCPNCGKKRYRGRSRRRFISRRHFKGGYIYNNKSMKEEDVTMELSHILSGSKSMSKSRTKSKSRGTRRQRH